MNPFVASNALNGIVTNTLPAHATWILSWFLSLAYSHHIDLKCFNAVNDSGSISNIMKHAVSIVTLLCISTKRDLMAQMLARWAEGQEVRSSNSHTRLICDQDHVTSWINWRVKPHQIRPTVRPFQRWIFQCCTSGMRSTSRIRARTSLVHPLYCRSHAYCGQTRTQSSLICGWSPDIFSRRYSSDVIARTPFIYLCWGCQELDGPKPSSPQPRKDGTYLARDASTSSTLSQDASVDSRGIDSTVISRS